jgi:hypothetical protein
MAEQIKTDVTYPSITVVTQQYKAVTESNVMHEQITELPVHQRMVHHVLIVLQHVKTPHSQGHIVETEYKIDPNNVMMEIPTIVMHVATHVKPIVQFVDERLVAILLLRQIIQWV